MATQKSSKAKAAPGAKRPAKKAAAPAKPATTRKAAATQPAPAAKPAAEAAGKKGDKLVRDGFTIPKSEYAVLQTLKARAASLGCSAKKSEVLRAGVMALAAMRDAAFAAVVGKVPKLKTGRPASR